MRKKIQLTHAEYISLMYQVFTTRKGKLLLELWEDQFLYRKIMNEDDTIGNIGIKQGEQQFILSIVNLIEQQQDINNKG